jgi:hypothetical protein
MMSKLKIDGKNNDDHLSKDEHKNRWMLIAYIGQIGINLLCLTVQDKILNSVLVKTGHARTNRS